MEMRTRGAPDLSGNCFKWAAIRAHLLIADGSETRWKHANADTNIVFNNTICFYVLQEILQCGHAFEVEKILSDERYQTLKVSTWKRKGLLAFSTVMLWNCHGSDLHLPAFKDMELFRKVWMLSLSEHVFLITSLPRFLPAVHKCVWGWT